jgi:hypothetical protein
MSRPHTHGLLHLLHPVVLTSPYRVLLTFMLGATLAAATYRERPNPRDGSIHFNRSLFALQNIFFECLVLDVQARSRLLRTLLSETPLLLVQ